MAALPPRSSRRRPRRGSLERPVSGACTAAPGCSSGSRCLLRPSACTSRRRCRAPQALPASFDGPSAAALASELAAALSGPRPGSAGAAGAAQWFRDQLTPYGLRVAPDRFRARRARPRRAHARQPGRDRPGRSPDEIVLSLIATTAARGRGEQQRLRHRGADPARPLLRDSARCPPVSSAAHARLRRNRRRRVRRPRRETVRRDPSGPHRRGGRASTRSRATARPRLVLIGSEPRLASPGFVETAAERVVEQTGRRPEHPGALAQLVDLGFPFTLHEQGPLLARGSRR